MSDGLHVIPRVVDRDPELCGFGHSGMKGWLYVHTPEDYKKWADENLAPKPQ